MPNLKTVRIDIRQSENHLEGMNRLTLALLVRKEGRTRNREDTKKRDISYW